MRRSTSGILLGLGVLALLAAAATAPRAAEPAKAEAFTVHPIGHVAKADGKTVVVLDKKYEPGLLGMKGGDDIWVIWWFDRNDRPEQRAILQVHPRGNPDNPLTGVFSTRSPVRPNLLALTKCKVVAVQDNVIEVDAMDAYPDTPVLDIKRAFEAGN